MDILEQQEISQSKYISWHIVVVVENPVLLSVISLGPTLPKQYKRVKALQRPQLGEELRPPKNGAINVEKWMTIKSLTMTIWRYKGENLLPFFSCFLDLLFLMFWHFRSFNLKTKNSFKYICQKSGKNEENENTFSYFCLKKSHFSDDSGQYLNLSVSLVDMP